MKDIKDNFVPYIESEQLRELGFDKEGFAFFYGDKSFNFFNDEIHDEEDRHNHSLRQYLTSPLWQQAWGFFRERKMESYIRPNNLGAYDYQIYYLTDSEFDEWEGKESYQIYSSYEEAQLECLRTLIKLCKK